MTYRRFAIYHAPAGDFGEALAAWLGWSAERGCAISHPATSLDLASITERPRKYGAHATLRAPFRLAEGLSPQDLDDHVARLAAQFAPVVLDGLAVTALGSFLALTPQGDTTRLAALAAAVVEGSNPWRAPLLESERARRNPAQLSPRQCAFLDAWGYPYVMEEFRFHITLSGPLKAYRDAIRGEAERIFAPFLGVPHPVDALVVFGEREDGHFEVLSRHSLEGTGRP